LEKELVAIETQAMEDGRFLSESAKELPELENQKQLWVSMRNFKEAGRVANDIKTLQGKRQDSQKRLEDSKSGLEEKRANLATLQNEIIAANTEVDRLTARLENEKLRDYLAIAQQLEKTIDQVSQATPPPEETVSNALLLMLRAELDSCTERARVVRETLGDKVDVSSASEAPQARETESGAPEDVQPSAAEDMTNTNEEDDDLPVAELEAMLESAIQSEDFDLADQLSNRIQKQKTREQLRAESSLETDQGNVTIVEPVIDQPAEVLNQHPAESVEEQTELQGETHKSMDALPESSSNDGATHEPIPAVNDSNQEDSNTEANAMHNEDETYTPYDYEDQPSIENHNDKLSAMIHEPAEAYDASSAAINSNGPDQEDALQGEDDDYVPYSYGHPPTTGDNDGIVHEEDLITPSNSGHASLKTHLSEEARRVNEEIDQYYNDAQAQ